ncbi:uncharacterized protein CC84DRAFT_361958 [Paraphaeosphaeria sporulosa]|uniref:Uncharacterized protein n=1 Tax=Paraphaeosphaeria sporulosa TaxID=1460663 RepID=A0A177BXC7_9PLEO|nr:uncharacterized protein CC84DRAFT_361958 [Paraphaeosphaeria sporulosa]OAG00164.1 hypothetical protein CC84DRAFT_361958 [Paraphaeosphaeria sporulosa]
MYPRLQASNGTLMVFRMSILSRFCSSQATVLTLAACHCWPGSRVEHDRDNRSLRCLRQALLAIITDPDRELPSCLIAISLLLATMQKCYVDYLQVGRSRSSACLRRITMPYKNHVQPLLFPKCGVMAGFMRCTIHYTACRQYWRYSVASDLILPCT